MNRSRKIMKYPVKILTRHRSGGIDDHDQGYHTNIGKKYGNFRPQMSPHFHERRLNNPPQMSNWSYFASKWNMGVSDLDDFARHMGYESFDEMETRISPWELYNKNRVRFKYALRKTSDKGERYFKDQPREVVEHELEETASVSGWLDKKKETSSVAKLNDFFKENNLPFSAYEGKRVPFRFVRVYQSEMAKTFEKRSGVVIGKGSVEQHLQNNFNMGINDIVKKSGDYRKGKYTVIIDTKEGWRSLYPPHKGEPVRPMTYEQAQDFMSGGLLPKDMMKIVPYSELKKDYIEKVERW